MADFELSLITVFDSSFDFLFSESFLGLDIVLNFTLLWFLPLVFPLK